MTRFLLLIILGGYMIVVPAKSPKRTTIKIVPIVKFEGATFFEDIDFAFKNPKEYMEISSSREKTTFKKFYYGKGMEKFWGENNETNELKILKNLFNIDERILLEKDSIFFVYVNHWKGNRPFIPNYTIYGCKKNGEYLFSTTDGKQPMMSFGELIENLYGSFDNFKRYFISCKESELTHGMLGVFLIPSTYEKMEEFVVSDYTFYEVENPKDTLGILNRFISTISKYVPLELSEKQILKNKIIKYIENSNYSKELLPRPINTYTGWIGKKCIVLGANVFPIIEKQLNDEQINKFKEANERHNVKIALCAKKIVTKYFSKDAIKNMEYIGVEDLLKIICDNLRDN